MNFEWLWCVHVGSLVITNVPSGGDVNSWGGYACVGKGVYGISMCLPINFAMNLKTSLPLLLPCHGCPFCNSFAFLILLIYNNLQFKLLQSRIKCLLPCKRETSTSNPQTRSHWSSGIEPSLILVWPTRLLYVGRSSMWQQNWSSYRANTKWDSWWDQSFIAWIKVFESLGLQYQWL